MRQINVDRDAIPADFTAEHERVLTHGHERGVVQKAADKVAQRVLGFCSGIGVGVSVFGGLTFVDVSGRRGGGPVRISIID